MQELFCRYQGFLHVIQGVMAASQVLINSLLQLVNAIVQQWNRVKHVMMSRDRHGFFLSD
jgi:ABC-type protease/lipase transport system fused ATPase/permease subunit